MDPFKVGWKLLPMLRLGEFARSFRSHIVSQLGFWAIGAGDIRIWRSASVGRVGWQFIIGSAS